ncbi:MAG: hypothetical protein NC133_02955 [Prevotella sp.]|nr:hypothetical protein [Prevotella sp.]
MANSFSHKNAILRNKHTKVVCFIGHRKIVVTDKLIADLTAVIQRLIAVGIKIFNFGSHSQFDDLCHQIVTNLQKQFSQIQRVHYCAPYENYTNVGMTEEYDQEIDCQPSFAAGKKAYLVRNLIMINQSDICVFYFDETYTPPRQKNAPTDLSDYQPQSGTALAYHYAVEKQKAIINLYPNGCADHDAADMVNHVCQNFWQG